MSKKIIISGSTPRGKSLRQKYEMLNLLSQGKKVGLVTRDGVLNLNEFVSFEDNMSNDDKLDALNTALDSIRHHTCPYCGHKFPNYAYYTYDGGRIYICPKCNKQEDKSKIKKSPKTTLIR